MVCATFYRSKVTRPGNVLSMFRLACSFAKVALRRHAFGDGLDNFLLVMGDQAGPCSIDVLACLLLCQGGPLQSCFLG